MTCQGATRRIMLSAAFLFSTFRTIDDGRSFRRGTFLIYRKDCQASCRLVYYSTATESIETVLSV